MHGFSVRRWIEIHRLDRATAHGRIGRLPLAITQPQSSTEDVMHRTSRGLLFVLSVLLLASCGDDDDPTGPVNNNLVGTWDATAIQLTSVANPGTVVELISQGANGRLVLQSNGDFGLSVGIPGETTEFGNGTWSSTDVLTLYFGEGDIQGTWQFDIDLNGDSLRLTGADAEWDFDDDGTDEPAKLDLTLSRS
jgi:hypothetical protein